MGGTEWLRADFVVIAGAEGFLGDVCAVGASLSGESNTVIAINQRERTMSFLELVIRVPLICRAERKITSLSVSLSSSSSLKSMISVTWYGSTTTASFAEGDGEES